MFLFQTVAGRTAVKFLVAAAALLFGFLGVVPVWAGVLVAGVALLRVQAEQVEFAVEFAAA